MKKYFLIIAVAILLLLAAAQSYFLYQKKLAGGPADKTPKEVVWENVLVFPGPGATPEEQRAHFVLAEKTALAADEIDLTGCKANPVVVRMKEGDEIRVKNSDGKSHVLLVSADEKYSIEANSTKSLKPLFLKGPGLYGYNCDDKLLVGILLAASPVQ